MSNILEGFDVEDDHTLVNHDNQCPPEDADIFEQLFIKKHMDHKDQIEEIMKERETYEKIEY